MKKVIISLISIISILILIGETDEITMKIIVLKFLSLVWLYLVAKTNNYFYQ